MEDLVIRPATAADIPDITDIYADAVLHGTATFELEPPTPEEMQRRFEAVTSGGHPYVVAVLAGAVKGYGYAGPYRTRPAYGWTVEDSIYLAPDAQRRGIGRRVLAELIGEAEARGFRQMVGIVGDSAHVASIRVHQAAGFQMVGTLNNVGYKFGRWLDTVILERPLGPGAAEPPGDRG